MRQVITEARQYLDGAAASLQEVLDDELFVAETPMEVQAAMEFAANAIEVATRSLHGPTAERSISPIPGGPTRKQGQFLAYIREYMLRNHLGLAPTHAELRQFFNLTPPSVNSMLKRLDQKGFIRRIPGEARAIELTINPELIPPLDRPFKQ